MSASQRRLQVDVAIVTGIKYPDLGHSKAGYRSAQTSDAAMSLRAKAIAAAKERSKLLRAKP